MSANFYIDRVDNSLVDNRGRGHGEVIRRFIDEDGQPQTVVSKAHGQCGWRREIKPVPEHPSHGQWRASVRERLERQRALSEALRR